MSLIVKKTNALTVADYLIDKANKENKPITNKKLQKLLYYVQAWSIAIRNKKIFDDKIEAWIHGPAIRKVYLEFKEFGASPISKKVNQKTINNMDQEVKKFIDKVWNIYSKYDAPYLEHLTHSESPWQDARKGLEADISSNNEISFDSMRSFYKTKLTANTN
jgi:uncharacterized phage-associated protein